MRQVDLRWRNGLLRVPDLSFLDGRAQVYEALRQRLSTVFEEVNPTGVRIDLDDNADDETSRLNV